MSYKKTKKAQKPKIAHLVSHDLITSKRFDHVVTLLKDKTELTNHDRYLYGYSLLQTQQPLNALITLWPLASKKQNCLEDDCTAIADHVFEDDIFVTSAHLSEDELYTLFLAASTLNPKNSAYNAVKQRLFDSLWRNGNYEKLERILKSTKEKQSVSFVENLGKLAFHQAKSKLTGGIPAFIGLVLTGGSCLITQHLIYHTDIEEEIRALGHEIKLLFSQLKAKGSHKLAWDTPLIENYIDYEAGILIEILQERVRQGESSIDITPTPSYVMTYDGVNGQLSQSFLPWLDQHNHVLVDLYQPDTQQVVLWALSGEKLSVITGILKSVQKNKLHPYLRLAIMLRAEYLKQSSLLELVLISDFENGGKTSGVLKNIAVQTAKSILKSASSIMDMPGFRQMLIKFYPVLNDLELKNAILSSSLAIFQQQYQRHERLDFSAMNAIARQLDHVELIQQLNAFSERQNTCSQFTLNCENVKQSKKFITAIKDEQGLRAHLALIADSLSSVPEKKYLLVLIQHLQSLIENKRINKLIHLKNLFECDFDCGCLSCIQTLLINDIPSIIEKLNIPVVRFPEFPRDTENHSSISNTPKLSVLSQPSPFTTLALDFTDSKPMIMQKMMTLIQQSPDKMAIFRQAQSEIFNPAQRFLHHYLRSVNHQNRPIELDKPQLLRPVISSLNHIPLRRELFNAD